MWFPLPFEVIWKHNMGQRHWTWFDLLSHTFAIYFAAFFISIFFFPTTAAPFTDHQQRMLENMMERQIYILNGFVLLLWILGLANLWEIRKRKKAGIEWHTYYRGEPRFLPNTDLYNCLVIPLGSGLIAYGVFHFARPLGIYLFGMALSQFAHMPNKYKHEIEKLNRRDREIELANKVARIENDQRGGLDIVRIAKGSQWMDRTEEIERFEARWKNVLKSRDDSQPPAH